MIFGKQINRYYLKYAPMLLLGLLALFAVDYIQLVIPELYRQVVDGITYGHVVIDEVEVAFNMDFVYQNVCKPLFGVIIIMVIGRFLWRICFFGSGIKVETDIRNRMFDHCKNLSMQYYQVNKVGDLMSLFTNDLETVQDCFGSGILMFADAFMLGLLSIIKMMKKNVIMTLLASVPLLLMFLCSVIVGRYMEKKWDVRQAAFSELSDFSQESFSGIAVVKAFVKEFHELLAFRWINKKNEKANVDYVKASTLLNIFVTLFVESVICVILGYGGYLVHENIFTSGEIIEFLGYFQAVVWPIMAISELIEMSARGKASLNRIGNLLEAKQDVVDKPTAVDIAPVKGKIEFRHLSFRYPDGECNALDDVSFVIEAGENVGIVGKTGCGKTTLVDLILRTYNVDDGCLFVDDQDVNDVTIRSLRNYCAYVPQDNFLFSDTIENNIAFASEKCDEELVKRYAELADVHSNVKDFSHGYKTVLGERGVTVSGGQKQRISIARALMKDAGILILDDSVSAVDTNTEKIILQNLRNERKGKTTILIAHRITTIEKMDKIIYVEDGKVIDVGTHAQLLERCKPYQVSVELQRLEDEEGKE